MKGPLGWRFRRLFLTVYLNMFFLLSCTDILEHLQLRMFWICLNAFQSHFTFSPFKLFLISSAFCWLFNFCPLCPYQCFPQGLSWFSVDDFASSPLSAHISVSPVVSPSFTWILHFYFVICLHESDDLVCSGKLKCHRPSDINNRNLFPHSLEVRSLRSRCW